MIPEFPSRQGYENFLSDKVYRGEEIRDFSRVAHAFRLSKDGKMAKVNAEFGSRNARQPRIVWDPVRLVST